MHRARQSGTSYATRSRGRQQAVAALVALGGTGVVWGDGTQVQSGDGTDVTWSDEPPPPAVTTITSGDGTTVTSGDGTDATWSG